MVRRRARRIQILGKGRGDQTCRRRAAHGWSRVRCCPPSWHLRKRTAANCSRRFVRPIVTTSLSGRITGFNAAAVALFGSPARLYGRGIRDVLPFVPEPRDGRPGEAQGRLADATGRTVDLEVSRTVMHEDARPRLRGVCRARYLAPRRAQPSARAAAVQRGARAARTVDGARQRPRDPRIPSIPNLTAAEFSQVLARPDAPRGACAR